MSKAASYTYHQIEIGQEFSFHRLITEGDGKVFADMSGDHNPLHTDDEYARNSPFGRKVVHGMLVSSLFSRLVGMECPGERCLYLSQTLNFRSPIFYGDTVEVKGTVVSKSDSLHLVTIKTEILIGARLVIDGTAKVRVVE